MKTPRLNVSRLCRNLTAGAFVLLGIWLLGKAVFWLIQDSAQGPSSENSTHGLPAVVGRATDLPEDAQPSQQHITGPSSHGSGLARSQNAMQGAALLLQHDVRHGVATMPSWRTRSPPEKGYSVKEEDYPANKDMMQGIADEDGYIIVSFANDHMADFVINWVEHLEALGISAYTVGAMDGKLLARLLQQGVHTFAMQSKLSVKDLQWGSDNFHLMGRRKIELIHIFTEMQLSLILCDVDTVWMRSPFDYMKRYPEADVLVTSDHLAFTHMDDGLEDWKLAGGSAFNIGVLLFRPSSSAFAHRFYDYVVVHPGDWDQSVFNALVKKGMRAFPLSDPRRAKRLFQGNNGQLTLGILPVSIFCSGHTMFVSRMPEQLDLAPYVVHAVFQYSASDGKRHRMREFHLWNDPPSYYDHPVGFLTWDMDVPERMITQSVPYRPSTQLNEQQEGHFELVNHQLLQVRHALAISKALGRALVIPQLWAGMDRFWGPHDGRIQGAATPLPYRAPLDHILDLEIGFGADDRATRGMVFEHREHSFLSNARLPGAVNGSRVTVELCARGSEGFETCGDGSGALESVGDRVRLQAGLNDQQIRRALSNVNTRYKVMTLTSMLDAFTQFADRKAQAQFVRRTKIMTSIWCCVDEHPGHVWYDMWWDQPHEDRHGKQWTEWFIKVGP